MAGENGRKVTKISGTESANKMPIHFGPYAPLSYRTRGYQK
jgi:hypothetical protein